MMIKWDKNPFREFRAEQISSDLWKFYVPLPVENLITPRPLVLEGGRGSGKTMFFLCNSWRDRLLTISQEGKSIIELLSPPESVGIYYRVDTEFVKAMIDKDRNDWDRIFSTYVGICFFQEILLFLKEVTNSGLLSEVELLPTLSIIDRLSKKDCVINSINHAIETCDTILDEIQFVPDNPAYTDMAINFMSAGRILKITVDRLKELSIFKDAVFRIYIDEYETLLKYQQEIINTLIKHSSKDLIFNIGLRPNGMKSRQIIGNDDVIEPPHDYNYVKIESLFIPDDSKDPKVNYNQVLFEICNRRLKLFKNCEENTKISTDIKWYLDLYSADYEIAQLTNDKAERPFIQDLIEEIKKNTQNIDEANQYIKLLALDPPPVNARLHLCLLKRSNRYKPTLDQLYEEYHNNSPKYNEWFNHNKLGLIFLMVKDYGVEKLYYGFDVFSMLSSGIIRYFLELCEKAFDFAMMNGFDWSDIRPITPREQTRAARYVSRYKINNIIQYEPYGRELRLFVQNFGEICSFIHNNPNSTLGEPEPNHFSTDYFKLDSASKDILLAGVYWAILQERESSKDKDSMPVEFYDYHLNHVYCPYFGISYRKKHKIELSSTLVMDLLSGDDQKAKHATISFLSKLKPAQQGSLFGGEYSDD